MIQIQYKGKPGDILICQGSSWISRAIMKITGGVWSHTALYTEVWNRPGVIEAQKNGVNFKLWDVWRNKWNYSFIVFRHNAEFDSKELMIKAFEQCGETKYDFFTFFRRAFGDRKKRSSVKENKKFICSEFTAYMFGIPNGYDQTPQEQFDYLVNSNQWSLIYTSK